MCIVGLTRFWKNNKRLYEHMMKYHYCTQNIQDMAYEMVIQIVWQIFPVTKYLSSLSGHVCFSEDETPVLMHIFSHILLTMISHQ